MDGYNNIFEIIEKENDEKLKQYFVDRPQRLISGKDNRSTAQNKVILKSVWTYKLLKNSFDIFFKYGKEYFKWGRKDNKWKPLHWKNMTIEDKRFFWYDLSKIDYNKVNNLNIDELKFIMDNVVNVSRNSVRLIDNISVNMFSLKFSKKIKKIRNKKLVSDVILKSAFLKNISNKSTKDEYNDYVKLLEHKQKLLKDDFQAWIIDLLRKEWYEVPDITNIKPKEELEVNLIKNIYKQL